MTTLPGKPPSLYAAREPIFPRRAKGAFRRAKWWIMALCLGIYYITPWLRWERGPNLPDQAVLIDMAHRRFFFFMIEIWPHEFYFVAGLLIMAGLGLFLFTSAMGRVWCGYACPQTVWTDLFILVERWIEGDRNAQIRLHRQGWSAEKIYKRAVKWSLWAAIALMTGGAWIFYFTDAPSLLRDLFTFNASPVAWITMLILTATTFVFGGFAREQICIYACPWPRIQAAMMDEETITVAYRDWRGEPRGKQNDSTRGACIDCMACVNVCPMGIDIRDGQQLACITCGLCIDACNEMMDKIGQPRGLVGYLALTDEERERKGAAPRPVWTHILRPRILLYSALWLGVGLMMLIALFLRSDIDANVTPVRNPTYVMLSDGTIRNAYDLRLRNKLGQDQWVDLSLAADVPLALSLEGASGHKILLPANETTQVRAYVLAAPGSLGAAMDRSDLAFWIEKSPAGEAAALSEFDAQPRARISVKTIFNGKAE